VSWKIAAAGAPLPALEYDFSAGQGTRAVYANTSLPLGQPMALRLWVRGDGGGAWLRARLRDAHGRAQIVDFTATWAGWTAGRS